MQYKKREFTITGSDGPFTIGHYSDEPSHKFFALPTVELKPSPKVGKQKGRNYALFLNVFNLLKDKGTLTHEAITTALDPETTDAKLHHAVSAVLSGNHDVFLNDRKAETWSLQADASDWLVNRKPKGPTDVQKKAAAIRKLLRAIEKGSTTEVPAWFEGIVIA